MKRVFALLVVLAGCQQPHAGGGADTPSATPAPAQVSSLTPHASTDIKFSTWPTATDSPVDVNPLVAQMCALAAPPPARVWSGTGGGKRHGPHFRHWIVVRVNPAAMEAFKAGDKPLPVGTVIVKEKHTELPENNPPTEYGAMVKREPGYDPKHGDWEYVYVVRQPEKQVARGRLGSCIECHAHAKDSDYLFRTYLPGKAGAVSEW